MKKNPNFSLQDLHGALYLMPHGQAVADRLQALRVEEVGAFLWEALDTAPTREALLEQFVERVQASPEEVPQARVDLDVFLAQLTAFGLLESEEQPTPKDRQCYQLAGCTLALEGDRRYFPRELEPFTADDHPAQQVIRIEEGKASGQPGDRLVLRSQEVEIHRRGDQWVLSFPPESRVCQGVVSPEGQEARFTVRPAFEEEDVAAVQEELFHAIRPVFLLLGKQRGLFALHGVSVEYRGRAWIFSAPSGTGKSTHARLWEQEFGVPQINGDLGLLAFTAPEGHSTPDTLWLQGGPWCGTSGIFTTRTVPVGGIVLLTRGADNQLEPLTADRRQLLLANRLVSPFWTRELLEKNLAFAWQVTEKLPVWRYRCTKAPEAAHVLKAAIDQWLEKGGAS